MSDLTGRVIRGYEIRDKIGEGGNGAIYLAHQSSVERDVAIKVILPQYASKPEFKTRFESEARLIAQLEHPYIVPLHDYWQDDDGAFLVMRWLRGGSLRDALNENPAWLLSKTAHLVNQITDALAVAHDANVIHRDIKPENILLDDRGNAYLTDFGIAKDLQGDSHVTAADGIVGTAAYFAPEQIQSQPVSPQTDIYSLGMMIFEMLAGEHPYGELSPVTLVMKHLQEPLPLLHDKRPEIPPVVHDILEKATAKDASDRYSSAPEFAKAFQQAIQPDKLIVPPQASQPESNTISSPVPQTPEDRNRSRMLEKVQDFWIDGVLNNSVHGTALMALGMTYQTDAVDRPWDMVLQQADQRNQQLPTGIRITDVFHEMRGELLILGDPGGGKTTTLLELARDLILLAQMDSSQPMPVVFNLSSWADKRQPLDKWMVEELHDKYQIPVKIAQDWVDRDLILPLLDGLDEVRQGQRDACVVAINVFREERGLLPMVVCSRIADYEALSQRLKLQGAITLQPLTREQVTAYLADAGDELRAVRAVLEDDEKLQRLVTSPLMLSIVMLAYRGLDLGEIPSFDTLSGRRRHLFDTYVDRMLKRRGADDRYDVDETRDYLEWLAGQMSDRAQSVYHIENMQPDWLSSKWNRLQYEVGIRLYGAVTSMLFFSVFFFITGILLSISTELGPADNIVTIPQLLGYGVTSLFTSIVVGTIVGGIVGLILMTVLFIFRRKIRPVERLTWSGRRAIFGALVFGISFAFICATFFNFFATYSYVESTIRAAAPRQFNLNEDTSEYESVTVTRFDGTVVDVPFNGFSADNPELSAILAQENPLYMNNFLNIWGDLILDSVLNFILVGLLTGAISGAVIGGLTGKEIDLRTEPNQGFRQSRKNFIRIGLAYSGITLVSFFGSLLVFIQPDVAHAIMVNRATGWLGAMVIIGFVVPTIGFIIALSRGGYMVVQHGVLRTLLWREKSMPRDISKFLDYTSERVLTRKVGGGYIFIHRMLLEHFAHPEKAKHQIAADELDDTYEPLHRLEDRVHRTTDRDLQYDTEEDLQQYQK